MLGKSVVALLYVVLSASCSRLAPPTAATSTAGSSDTRPRLQRELRLTGIVEAVHSSKVLVPQIVGQNGGRQTLTHLIANGTQVKTGDVIAEFDPTPQLDAEFAARAKYEDLGHQVEQKAAQNRADAEKRRADVVQAEADLRKALLEVEKAPILGEIDRNKNDVKAEIARQHIQSLLKSNEMHDTSDAAALRILELQRDRQKVAMDRAQSNIQRLHIKATQIGMVAHQNVFRGNTNGHAQEGDQLWDGQAIANIFDPTEMLVRCLVGEPDGAALAPGIRVMIYLDAYPDVALPGHFEAASPIASSALGSPIKTFTAVFKLDKTDARLLPDLSAAVVIEPRSVGNGATGGGK